MSKEKEAKLKALKLTLDKLDKAYGKGTVMKMSDAAVIETDVIPSGSLGLDLALASNNDISTLDDSGSYGIICGLFDMITCKNFVVVC